MVLSTKTRCGTNGVRIMTNNISFTKWLKLHEIVGVRPDTTYAKRTPIACANCHKYKFLYHISGDDEYFSSYCYSCMKDIYNTLVKEETLECYIEQM